MMNRSKYIRILKVTMALVIFNALSMDSSAQDTIAGNYADLVIKSGIHFIKESVTVKGKLEIQPGAKIEFTDPGVLVCEGGVLIK